MNKIIPIAFLFFVLTGFCQAQNITQGESWSEVNFVSKSFKRNLLQFDLYYNTIGDTATANMFEYTANHGIGLWYHFYPTSSIRLSAFWGWEHFHEIEARNEAIHERFRGSLFAQFNNRANRLTLSHRIAADLLSTEQDNHSYTSKVRLRYRFRLLLPINKTELVKGALYTFVLDEIFLNTKKSPGIINQNRIQFSLGYCITENIQFEPSYIFVSSQNNGGGRTFTHVAQFSLVFNNIFRKLSKE